jgi:hypothetical protein
VLFPAGRPILKDTLPNAGGDPVQENISRRTAQQRAGSRVSERGEGSLPNRSQDRRRRSRRGATLPSGSFQTLRQRAQDINPGYAKEWMKAMG